MITGDDILIEYVARLVKVLSLVNVDQIQADQISSVDKFVTHYVWKQPDQLDLNLTSGTTINHQIRKRLVNRLNEMTDRRRRLIKYNYKKEENAHLFESQYPETIRRKEQVILKFSSVQLEELLNNSTKNVAQEVVTCLIPRRGGGVLVTLESQKNSSAESETLNTQSKNKLMSKAHRSSASHVCYTN